MAATTKGKASQPATRHSAFHDSDDDDDDNDAARSTHRSSGRQEEIFFIPLPQRRSEAHNVSSPLRTTPRHPSRVQSRLAPRPQAAHGHRHQLEVTRSSRLHETRRLVRRIRFSQHHGTDNAADAINTDAQRAAWKSASQGLSTVESHPAPSNSEETPAPAPDASVQGTDEEAIKALWRAMTAQQKSELILSSHRRMKPSSSSTTSNPDQKRLRSTTMQPLPSSNSAWLCFAAWDGRKAWEQEKVARDLSKPPSPRNEPPCSALAQRRGPSQPQVCLPHPRPTRTELLVNATTSTSPLQEPTVRPLQTRPSIAPRPAATTTSLAATHIASRRAQIRHVRTPCGFARWYQAYRLTLVSKTLSQSNGTKGRSAPGKRKGEDDAARRSHAASSSSREHRRDRDRDDRDRHDKYRDDRHRDRRR